MLEEIAEPTRGMVCHWGSLKMSLEDCLNCLDLNSFGMSGEETGFDLLAEAYLRALTHHNDRDWWSVSTGSRSRLAGLSG